MSIMNILPLFAQGAIMEAYNLTDLDTALIIAVLAVVAFVVYELVHRYKNGSEPAEDDYADNKSASENVNEEENFKKEKTINVRVGNKYAGMDTPTLVKAILKDLNLISCFHIKVRILLPGLPTRIIPESGCLTWTGADARLAILKRCHACKRSLML